MTGSRRLLTAMAALALLPLAACSKTDDEPAVREIFGTAPLITQQPSITVDNEAHLNCDVADAYRFVAQQFGLDPNLVAADLADLEVGMDYTEFEISVTVADEDDDPAVPGQDDILAVTATFVPPGQPEGDTMEEESLVLFDDGSANKFSYTQIGTTNLVCSESGGFLVCERVSGFLLTSNDGQANDGKFTRRIAVFDLDLAANDTTLLLQDCLALVKGQAVLDVNADQTFDFRLDVVDRAGNITTWPNPLPVTAQKTVFTCTNDECLCCLLQTAVFTDCRQLPGYGGLCNFF